MCGVKSKQIGILDIGIRILLFACKPNVIRNRKGCRQLFALYSVWTVADDVPAKILYDAVAKAIAQTDDPVNSLGCVIRAGDRNDMNFSVFFEG